MFAAPIRQNFDPSDRQNQIPAILGSCSYLGDSQYQNGTISCAASNYGMGLYQNQACINAQLAPVPIARQLPVGLPIAVPIGAGFPQSQSNLADMYGYAQQNQQNQQNQQQQSQQNQQNQQQQSQQNQLMNTANGYAVCGAQNVSTAGVMPVLDYDLEQMVKFVSWFSYGLMRRVDSPGEAFHSSVRTVLSATRLPKSTILLSLVYLSDRIEKSPVCVNDQNDELTFERLVIALVLANKFNDDNTFRNKSWSEATGLSLRRVNRLEAEWLCVVGWRLHYEDGFSCVEECWNTWCRKFSSPVIRHSHSPSSYSVNTFVSDDFAFNTGEIASSPASSWLGDYKQPEGVFSAGGAGFGYYQQQQQQQQALIGLQQLQNAFVYSGQQLVAPPLVAGGSANYYEGSNMYEPACCAAAQAC